MVEKHMENRKHTCCHKQKVKRGLWSPDEDEKLVKHVTTYGHGSWAQVPRLAGLQRCGKSCRLRWINYLRPDLKKGSFAPHEAVIILELHRMVGNKWAEIAKQLPGRTDNEVKNFWNSSLKKKIHNKFLSYAKSSRNRSYANNYDFISNDPIYDHLYLANAFQEFRPIGSALDQVTATLNTNLARPFIRLAPTNADFIPPDHLNPTQADFFNQDEIFMNALENTTPVFQNPNFLNESNHMQAFTSQDYSMLDFNGINFGLSTHDQQVLEPVNNHEFPCFQQTFNNFQDYPSFEQPTIACESANVSTASSSSPELSFLAPPAGSRPLFADQNLDLGWVYHNAAGVNY